MSMTYEHEPRPPATLLAEWQQSAARRLQMAENATTDAGPLDVERYTQDWQVLGLFALTAAAELARAVLADRWPVVDELLRTGVDIERIAAAVDMNSSEVRSGFRGWCKGQRTLYRQTGGRQGMTAPQYAEAMALAPEPAVVR